MAPPNVLPPKRTCSESEIREIKKTVEKKPQPCEEKDVKSVQNFSKVRIFLSYLSHFPWLVSLGSCIGVFTDLTLCFWL